MFRINYYNNHTIQINYKKSAEMRFIMDQMHKLCHDLFNHCHHTLKYTLQNGKISYEEYKPYITTNESFKELPIWIAHSISIYVHNNYNPDNQSVKMYGSKKSDIRLSELLFPKYLVSNELVIKLNEIFIEKYQLMTQTINIPLNPFILNKKVKSMTMFPYKESEELFLVRFNHVSYSEKQKNSKKRTNEEFAIGIDLGQIIFAGIVSSKDGDNFLIRASQLRTAKKNYLYEKNQMIKSAMFLNKRVGNEKLTSKLRTKESKRKEFPLKAAKKVIEYCLEQNITIIVIGFDYKLVGNVGVVKNKIYSYEHRDFVERLIDLAKPFNIKVNLVDEIKNYTSQTSFFTGKKGKRDRENNRGLFEFEGNSVFEGGKMHSDINSSGNMLLEPNSGVKVDKKRMYKKMMQPPRTLELYEKKKKGKKKKKTKNTRRL